MNSVVEVGGVLNTRPITGIKLLFDFCVAFVNNVLVMSSSQRSLENWLRNRESDFDSATLGQLITLLELGEATSVASISDKATSPSQQTSMAVNYRQKLTRLEHALGVGKLTQREGKFTQPTKVGRKVADEVRLFLEGLSRISITLNEERTWIIGAGNAWIQFVVLPAVGMLLEKYTHWRWEVQEMNNRDVVAGLKSGKLHFGFIRAADSAEFEADDRKRDFAAQDYRIVFGGLEAAPKAAGDVIRWLTSNGRPFVQQASTWSALRTRLAAIRGVYSVLEKVEPRVRCTNHAQALASARASSSWCIVPESFCRTSTGGLTTVPLGMKSPEDTMALVRFQRYLDKFSDGDMAYDVLGKAIHAIVQH